MIDEEVDEELLASLKDFGPELATWGDEYTPIEDELPEVYGEKVGEGAWRRNYKPLASQQAFHDLKTRYKGFSGPVGSGKSAALCREALRLAFANPGCPGLIGAPTYGMLADVTRAAFFEHLDGACVKYRFLAGRNLVRIAACDATIFFRSLSDPSKLVGKNLAWAGIDEVTFCPEESWKKVEARIRLKKAKELALFGAWTPRGFDWAWKRFRNPDTKLPNHECIFAKPRENEANLADGYYDSLKNSYDAQLFAQEALGEYLNVFSGRVYYGFDRDRNGALIKERGGLKVDVARPICWSMDFNVGRMSSIIGQYHAVIGDQPSEMSVLDEIILTNSNTAATCDEFLYRLDRLTAGTALASGVVNVRIYGDAAGESRSSKADTTDYEIIRRWARRNAHRVSLTFHVQDANPSVRARVAAVNGMLFNEAERTRLFVAPHCKGLIEDLEQVGWAKGHNGAETGEFDKSSAALTHISDAAGYWVWKEAGIRQRGRGLESTRLNY
jgi:hypothetical protein